jgi:hypothetical protein
MDPFDEVATVPSRGLGALAERRERDSGTTSSRDAEQGLVNDKGCASRALREAALGTEDHEDRVTMLGLMLKRSEHARLTALAHAQGHPTMSAFVRTRLPEIFLGEIAREGRKPGFSPKKKTA